MHPNVPIIVGAVILRVKYALERRTSVAMQIVRLPTHIDVSTTRNQRVQELISRSLWL